MVKLIVHFYNLISHKTLFEPREKSLVGFSIRTGAVKKSAVSHGGDISFSYGRSSIKIFLAMWWHWSEGLRWHNTVDWVVSIGEI